MKLLQLAEIREQLDLSHAFALQEEGFVHYSKGEVVVPPVGYFDFGKAVGEAHIKPGWIKGDSLFVVKVAGAYQRADQQGGSSAEGAIMLFDATTGILKAVLNDEGYLTNIRTAIAGAIAAKFLAPSELRGIGVVGTGLQARYQVELLRSQGIEAKVWVWGRSQEKVTLYQREMVENGFDVEPAPSLEQLCRESNLIITTTASMKPLIRREMVEAGTHITAVGADAPGKQELDPKLFAEADRCVVDSRVQCLDHGESFYPYRMGIVSSGDFVELGELIEGGREGRQSAHEITIADLTGVAVQDLQIAKSFGF